MCSSLKDGGLRCPSHVKKDIAKLQEADERGLNNAAKEAGVPIDQEYIDSRVPAYVANYTKEAEGHSAVVEASREQLLALHKETMAAKNALDDPSVRDSDDFVSPIHDLMGVKEALAEKFSRDAKPKLSEAEALKEIKNSPELNDFDRAEEYIDTVNLIAYHNKNVHLAEAELKDRTKNLTEQRLSDLHQNNPMLKKLRKKASIAEFLNTSSAYNKERAYEHALSEEMNRTNFKRATSYDFPETVASIKESNESLDRLRGQQSELRDAFDRNVNRLRSEGKAVKRADSYATEKLVRAAPPSGTFRELTYRDKLRSFNKLKDQYTELASKEYNVEKATAEFRAKVTAEAPFDSEKFKEFKKEVYNKSPEGKRIDAELREKRSQLYMTPQYRTEIGSQAARATASGDVEKATKLIERKRKLDAMAEATMGENRLKAISQSGTVPQEIKNVIKAQKQAAPAHYRTNLANAK
jgi:hypothetical protein